jgi:hypothetical protein
LGLQICCSLPGHAVQLKLDELIRAVSGAHNALLDLEGLEESDLERFRVRHEELARTAREALGRGELDYRHPESQAGLDHADSLTAVPRSNSTFWSSDSTYATVLSSLSLYKPKEAVGNDSLFRTTSSGTQRALTELRIDTQIKERLWKLF